MKTDLERLEKLERRATSGPWEFKRDNIEPGVVAGADGYDGWYSPPDKEDAELIVELRNSIPSLIAELKAAREIISMLQIRQSWSTPDENGKVDPLRCVIGSNPEKFEPALKAYEAAIGNKV